VGYCCGEPDEVVRAERARRARRELAANQIGVSLAAFSYDVDGGRGYVVNPRLVATDGEHDGPEACLSVPGVSAQRMRAAFARVEGVDVDGRPLGRP
jgi:peptide deformylase